MSRFLTKYWFIFSSPLLVAGQDAVHNFGELRVHDNAEIGFHTNFINDGEFQQALGLTGFYHETEALTVSGSVIPHFYDTEIIVDQHLSLEIPIDICNNGNLITGDITTPRSSPLAYSNFHDFSFYTGESSVSKVNGYAAFINKESFIYPVGDAERLRPLTIEADAIIPVSRCAYFFEDPNAPSSLQQNFPTSQKASSYMSVSDKEFWRLEGNVPARVTLSWDEYSNIAGLGDYLSDLKVVGWEKESGQWVNLGNTAIQGGRAYGSITSDTFVPDAYEILTIGGNADDLETYQTLDLGNYYMTPNGDGQNEILELEGIWESPNNSLQIFNRYGVLVYSKDNYNNDFDGKSNRDQVIARNSGLETGIYFYIITFHDLRQKHQGYLYINN